jgi:hypothetical protein
MEVDYNDKDLSLVILRSLSSSFANFRHTLLYSHDTIMLDEVSEASHKKKIKQMVSFKGCTFSEEMLFVCGMTK